MDPYSFDIWCIGDLNYLTAVLNALAMLADTRIFENLFAIGLLIAVILMGCQAMFQGAGSIPWGRFLLALLVYAFLFGWPAFGNAKRATVYIQDTYTLQTQPVANVPYGVAAAGSILSKMAHEITLVMEQAFSTPDMTEFGFGAPLVTLAKGQSFWTGVETIANGQVAKTLVEYCDKCTSTGINLDQKSVSEIKTAANPWLAMKWESDIYYAMTWVPGIDPPGGTLRSCTEAWATIDNYLQGTFWNDWREFLKSQYCTTDDGSCDPVMIVQDALNNLTQQQQDARNYIMSMVLLPAFEEGQMQFNSFMGKPEMAIIVGQAREQRNAQWQAEGSLFTNIMRPMMAFFEGFLYAITPFMALLAAFVPTGLSLVGKYFMMFVWVQLWMPIMAVLNHYLQIVAAHKLNALIDSKIPLTSIQGHLMGTSAINDWLATAGVLVASTPAISLALLFGGAITMTHLAGRLQHGDFVNEKIARPDVVQPAPMLNMEALAQSGPMHGTRATGAEMLVPKIEASQMASAEVQSSTAQMVTAQQNLREAVGRMSANGAMGSYGLSQQASSSSGIDARSGSKYGSISGFTQMMGKDLGLSQSETNKLAGNLTAGAGFFGSGANVTSGFDSVKGQQIQDYIKNNLDLSGNKSLQAAIDEKMSSMATTGQLHQYQDIFKQDDIANVEKAAQKVTEAKRQYSESQQMASRVGMSQSTPITAFGKAGAVGRLGTPEELLQKNQAWLPPGRIQDAADQVGISYNISDKEQAWWAGAALVMSKMSNYRGDDPGEKARVVMAGKTLLGLMDKGGFLAPDTGDATRFKGQVDTGKLEAGADHAALSAAGLPGTGDVAGNIYGIKGQIPGVKSPGEVRQWGEGKMSGIRSQQEEKLMEGAREQYQKTVDDTTREFGQKESWSQSFLQGSAGFLQALRTGAEQTAGQAHAYLKSGSAFLDSIDSGKGYSGSKEEAQQAWGQMQERMWNHYVQEGRNDMGLDDNLAQSYAYGAMAGWSMAAKERLGYDLPVVGLGQRYETNRTQVLQARTQYNQERGYSPEEAKKLAAKEVFLAERAGQTGMHGWAEKINQGDKIFSQARETRFQMSPAPPSGRGLSGTREQFAAGVHGEAARALHIKGASLEGLHPEMMVRLKAMSEEYHKITGKTINVSDGFRTYQQQTELKQRKGQLAAPPGRSMHGYGLAVDMDTNTAEDLAHRGLFTKYGLTRPISNEPWHVELTGGRAQVAKQGKGVKIM